MIGNFAQQFPPKNIITFLIQPAKFNAKHKSSRKETKFHVIPTKVHASDRKVIMDIN